jgi:hypothetical protein
MSDTKFHISTKEWAKLFLAVFKLLLHQEAEGNTFYGPNGSKISKNSLCSWFLLHRILILHCRSQVLELCHTIKGPIIRLYVVTSSCILLVKQTCRSILLLAAYKASMRFATVMFPPNKLTSSEARVSRPVSVFPF